MEKVENILVTGFGPFGEHKVNASWEAVLLLPNHINGFNVIKREVPVIYSHVEQKIPELWNEFNPKLVVHVGVASSYNEIKIETCANKCGYQKIDVSNTCPKDCRASPNVGDGKERVITDLCAVTICNHLRDLLNIKASVSDDAGRYLCEFTYYTSLNIDKARTLFVHVPPINSPFTKEELAVALEEIIKCGLGLVSKADEKMTCFPSTIYKNGRAAAVF